MFMLSGMHFFYIIMFVLNVLHIIIYVKRVAHNYNNSECVTHYYAYQTCVAHDIIVLSVLPIIIHLIHVFKIRMFVLNVLFFMYNGCHYAKTISMCHSCVTSIDMFNKFRTIISTWNIIILYMHDVQINM